MAKQMCLTLACGCRFPVKRFVIWWGGYGIQAKQVGGLVATTLVGS